MEQTIRNDLPQKYSKGVVVIHWITALLIITLFPLGKYMAGLEPSQKMGMIKAHAILGMIVFILTLIRSWMFFKTPRPAHLNTGSKLNDQLATGIHNIFYFLLFGLSVSGIATMLLGSYGNALISGNPTLIQNNAEILPLKGHGIMAMILMILLVMHVAGVIKHYLVKKENTLKRIS
ncbi:MAG TPA: hypothetical protein DCS93_08350 [Microscillaceae bacterium]|nr:hypothetical protein [Microscillaceae bacterium]